MAAGTASMSTCRPGQGLEGRDSRRGYAGRQPNRIGPEALVAECFGAKHRLAIRRIAQGVCGRRARVGRTGGWPAVPWTLCGVVIGAIAARETPDQAHEGQADYDTRFPQAMHSHIDSPCVTQRT